jgi:CheY-like chemotaxis protein
MRTDIAGQRVLLVEDDGVTSTVVSRMLGAHALVVDIARDGDSALELLRSEGYDLVFMDCHLPDTDGFEVTRRLRSSVGWATSPTVSVVALTGDRRGADVAPCLAAGMNAHLSKPVNLSHLAVALERWLPTRAPVL